MKKNQKILIGVVAIVLVVCVVVLAGKAELFQGRFFKITKPKLYLHKNKIVSVVTSPVTSVVPSEVTSDVPSEVTSEGGTSLVASKVTSSVPSAVTSPIASGVAVDAKTASRTNAGKLQNLTQKILESIARDDYKKFPSRFVLSDKERQKIIELYEQSNRR